VQLLRLPVVLLPLFLHHHLEAPELLLGLVAGIPHSMGTADQQDSPVYDTGHLLEDEVHDMVTESGIDDAIASVHVGCEPAGLADDLQRRHCPARP
jgi:hypothetical protein